MAHTNPTKQREEKSSTAGVAEFAKDTAGSLGKMAKDAASTAAQSVENAASFVGQKAGEATSSLGKGVRSLGSTVRENTPSSGMLGNASAAVADTLESSGRYLEEEGLEGLASDVTNMVRRNPIQALLLAVGVGFLLARATSRR